MCADDLPRKRPPNIYKPPTAEMLAYLDFSVSTTGMLTGVKARLVSFPFKSSCGLIRVGLVTGRSQVQFSIFFGQVLNSWLCVSFRYLTQQSMLYVDPSNCNVSCIPPDKLPSAWTPTVAWASCCGVCQGSTHSQRLTLP